MQIRIVLSMQQAASGAWRTGGCPRDVTIAGVTTGLISLDQEVTWQATHFGIRQKLTSKITACHRPFPFRDSQVRGAFRRFDHDHFFAEAPGATIMRNLFDYTALLAFLGKVADTLCLKAYLTSFLEWRKHLIKQAAESGRAA